MRSKLKQLGLVMTGVFAGVMLSLNFSANADRTTQVPLPVESCARMQTCSMRSSRATSSRSRTRS